VLIPLEEILNLCVDNRFDEIFLVLSLFESDVSLEGFGDHLWIVDESILLVDATTIATPPFIRVTKL